MGPFVRLVTTSAKVGKTVEILGQGFTGATAVSLNGKAAVFHIVSNTYLHNGCTERIDQWIRNCGDARRSS
ncbi:MAG: hypothetical protein ABSD75_31925 [Terriglobales bacterium]|jgi:hypothetical protein